MDILKKAFLISKLFLISLILASCILGTPPILSVNLAKYAIDNGADVPFSITVTNNPTSVTCFNGGVVMTTSGGGIYEGTADYTLDLLVSPGTNTVNCRAINAYGTTNTPVGFIELIPNIPPVIAMLPTVCIPNNNGSKIFNTVLVDTAASTNLTGSTFTLTAGTLPAGLSIGSANGNLIGTPVAGDFNPTGLKITATNLAGANESSAFTIDINETTCPP